MLFNLACRSSPVAAQIFIIFCEARRHRQEELLLAVTFVVVLGKFRGRVQRSLLSRRSNGCYTIGVVFLPRLSQTDKLVVAELEELAARPEKAIVVVLEFRAVHHPRTHRLVGPEVTARGFRELRGIRFFVAAHER